MLRKKLRRDQVLALFGQLPPCVVTMEACGGAHSGVARSVSWAMRCGSSRRPTHLVPCASVAALRRAPGASLAAALGDLGLAEAP